MIDWKLLDRAYYNFIKGKISPGRVVLRPRDVPKREQNFLCRMKVFVPVATNSSGMA
jgi:hypothetical protein